MTDKFGGIKASEALYLLGLIERHGWIFGPEDGIGPEAGRGPWEVETGTCFHRGATLIEALTQAANCPRCVGGGT